MALIAIIFFLVSSNVIVDALLKECPPLKSTSCTCEIKWGPSVTCSKIKDVEALSSHLQALKGYEIDSLTLSEVELPKLAKDTFKTLHLNQLSLEFFEVSSNDVLQFEGLEKTLKIITINNSFKKNSLSGLKLGNLENLESVLMSDNDIKEISNDWLAGGPKKLFTVLLQRNGIKSLGDKAFQSLDALKVLDISGNSVSQISRSMLPSNAKVIEKIDLSNNKIKEIPKGLLSEMPELIYVNLAGNLLNTLVEDNSILKNTHIHLEGNPLVCNNELGWICKNEVTLDNNTAKCDSPDSMKGYSLKVFCDIQGKVNGI